MLVVDQLSVLYLLSKKWRRGVVVITNAWLHSTKPELRFCAGSNPVCSVSEIRDGEDLWQWSRLGNKTKRLSSFNHTTKTIHHHHHIYPFIHIYLTSHHISYHLSFHFLSGLWLARILPLEMKHDRLRYKDEGNWQRYCINALKTTLLTYTLSYVYDIILHRRSSLRCKGIVTHIHNQLNVSIG